MNNNTVDIPVSEILGSTLAELRKSTGMTQRDFAKIFGVSESSIAHYEQGITIPGADMILEPVPIGAVCGFAARFCR